MSNDPTPIDLATAAPELQQLAEEVRTSMRPRSMQKDGEIIAIVMPVASRRVRRREKTKADEEAFLASAGGWKDLVDTERFKKDNVESRRRSSRPPVEL